MGSKRPGDLDLNNKKEEEEKKDIKEISKKARITIVYDNNSLKPELTADWGFAAVVEVKTSKIGEEYYGERVLFDTGADSNILLENMRKLNIDPRSIKKVFISHSDYDHVGGLPGFLRINSQVTLYLPASYSRAFSAKQIERVSNSTEIGKDLYSTGEIEGREQSLIVNSQKGLILVVGCAHPGLEPILESASQYGELYALVGGLHNFNNFEMLEDFQFICPTHCTHYKNEIQTRYDSIHTEGGVGKVIDF